MKKNSGFTLTELMVTLAIVGIIATVGGPSLKAFIQGSQLVSSSNELISALHVARSEAIKLNSRVTICESSNGTACATTGDWSNGWIVFVDADGLLDGTGAPCTATGTDCLLRIHDSFNDSELTIKGVDNNGAVISSFTFTSRGLPKASNGSAQAGVFSVCSPSGSRAVVLGLSGRVRVSDNAAVITCP
jgi:type IV fimbrial biogenesis protein FimT